MTDTITVTVEIPAPPAGTQVDKFRRAKAGEYFLAATGKWMASENAVTAGEYIVAAHIWQCPEWFCEMLRHLKAGWMTMDQGGMWCWSESEPVWIPCGVWQSTSGCQPVSWFALTHPDWMQAKFRTGTEA